MVAWRRLKEKLPKWMVVNANETELSIELLGGRFIELKGCDNYDSIRGGSPWIACFDEYAYCDPFAWEEVVQPALSDKVGKALFCSTPRGRNHFHTLYRYGIDGVDGWESFCYTTAEVGSVPAQELERLRRKMPTDLYQQEYEAVFLGHVGLIVPEFIPRFHPEGNIISIPEFDTFRKQAVINFGAMDWGIRNQTVHLWVSADRFGRMVVWDEYVSENKPAYDTGIEIRAKNRETVMSWTVLDKSAWRAESMGNSVADQFMRAGMPISPSDSRFEESISELRSACISRDGQMPMLMIKAGTCPTLQRQMATLQYSDKRKSSEEAIMGAHDAFDACRYAIMTKARASYVEEPRQFNEPRIKTLDRGERLHPVSGMPLE